MNTVRAKWLLKHRDRKGPLSHEDVHEIAALLLTERIQPTVEAIREVNNGRGSPNTIHPGLKSFYESGECERRMVRVVHADNMPARVVELWDELQALAKAAGEAQVRAQTDALADEASVLKMQWAALDKEQQIIRDRLEVAAQIEAELRARIVTLEASERHSREAAATHRNLFEAQQNPCRPASARSPNSEPPSPRETKRSRSPSSATRPTRLRTSATSSTWRRASASCSSSSPRPT